MIFAALWDWIRRLFGKKPLDQNAESKNAAFAKAYESTERISFCAIFSNALANKVVSDSAITVTDANGGEGRRAVWIEAGIEQVWAKRKKLIAQVLGKGGKVLLPYVANGKPYVDMVDQSRMSIERMQGDTIVSASILAEITRVDGRAYYRWQDYTLEGTTHSLITRVTNDAGSVVPFEVVPAWADITPEIAISGVDRILFGYIRSPVDNRKDADAYGVPITYGSERIIEELYTCLDDMAREYKLKRTFVGADERLFSKGGKFPEGGVFKKMEMATGLGGQAFWEVFDPAIRDSAYLNRYNQLCEQLEKSIGTSKGILTEPQTSNATATEIKSALYDTWTMVTDIRDSFSKGLNDLAYALDVLAEYFGATPAGARGDYLLTFDWDNSLLENSTETFTQLSELESRGLILPERLVAWATGVSTEEAQQEIEQAKQQRDAGAAVELGVEA